MVASCVSVNTTKPSFNREGEWLKVKVVRISPETLAKKDGTLYADKAGSAVYYLNDPSNECILTVVFRGRGSVDGEYTLTLGHELMHCLYGDYHE